LRLSPRELGRILEKTLVARDKFFASLYTIDLYDYQREISDDIVRNAIMRDALEANYEISRQAGKSVGFVLTEVFLSIINDVLYGEHVQVGFFAPKEQQVKTSFDRLKDYLPIAAKAFGMKFLESNSTTLVMVRPWIGVDGRSGTPKKAITYYAYTLGEGAHVESKTLHRAYVDEAQDIDDFKVKKEVMPMLSSTGGTLYRIGVAGYKNCDFKQSLDLGRHAVICPVERVLADRRKVFEQSGDERHLLYERWYQGLVQAAGSEDADHIKTQFRLIWIVERGNMTTKQKLDKCMRKFLCVGEPYVVVGVDLAKKSDSTVMTASTELGQRLCAAELKGHDYTDQYPEICRFCRQLEEKGYKVVRIRVDTTGSTGDAAAEALEHHRDCKWPVDYFYFAPQNKHNLYQQFLQLIEVGCAIAEGRVQDTGQRRFEYWEGDPCITAFEYQMLQMEKEYKGIEGNLLSCHHPDKPGAKDDHPDSTAMSVFKPQDEESRIGFIVF
jgi:hypothetical protein